MQRIIATLVLLTCLNCKDRQPLPAEINTPEWKTTLKSLETSESSGDARLLANYNSALQNYNNNPDADNTIWLGRRIAYTGAYNEAISIYTKGIEAFPTDARLYRHRGHRYISTRQFINAISDLSTAAQLIRGTEDQIEPDGVPNRLNQPISTLHTNIWYHLGLTHYLMGNLKRAKTTFTKCLEASTNDDNIVSASHWLYMIHRRLGNEEAANALLEPITKDMTIIENDAYHQLLLFYKGEMSEADLQGNDATGSSEAVQYGLANWYHYNGNADKAKTLYQDLVNTGNPAGFGYIAAEADLERMH